MGGMGEMGIVYLRLKDLADYVGVTIIRSNDKEITELLRFSKEQGTNAFTYNVCRRNKKDLEAAKNEVLDIINTARKKRGY